MSRPSVCIEKRRDRLSPWKIHFSILLLLGIGLACATPIGVKKVGSLQAQQAFSRNYLSTGKLSENANILLRRTNRVEAWKRDPARVLEELHAILQRSTDIYTAELRSIAVADLAELSYAHASQSDDPRYFLAAALYAWMHLFPAEGEPRPSVLRRSVRLTADIYNRGLTRALTDPKSGEVILRDGDHALPFGMVHIDFQEENLKWGDREFYRFASLADLSVRGLNNRYRFSGLGAPLAARITEDLDQDSQDVIFSGARVPVTALLQFERSGANLTRGEFEGILTLTPFSGAASRDVNGERVHLESEPSAALALQLTETPPWQRELKGFFQGDLAIGNLGIGSLAPYQKGKIPVVLVHGTASSVGRWADLLNDLQSDSVLRRHFQFWLFTYNTGNPIAYSGWLLRKSITELIDSVDPEHQDPVLNELVVMGHSQGGILTKLLVVDSGRRFWDQVISRAPDEIELEPENRELLEGSLLVRPSPYVQRVIFLSTPHHGSRLADFGLARMLGRMVRTPANLVAAASDVFSDDPEIEVQKRLSRGTGSIGNMSPDNYFVQALAATPIAPGVHAHSIIGVKKGPKETGTDGVVSYQSAHLPDVESELVVQSGHSSQSNPAVASEVHRILIEHLRLAVVDGVIPAVDLEFN